MSIALATETAPTVLVPKRDLRARIVDAAWTIGNEVSPERLTIRTIASRAGVSPALIYTYFADKSALLRELQRMAEPELSAMLKDAIACAGTPREGLLRVCIVYVAFARRHRWLYETNGSESASREAATGLARRFVDQATALLDAMGCQGSSTEQAMLQLRVAIDGLVAVEPSEVHADMDSRDFVESYVKMVLRGL